MVESVRKVSVRIDGAAAVAARMPAISGVVLVPRMLDWAARPMSSLLTRVRGEIVRAVTSNEARKSHCAAELKSIVEDAGAAYRGRSPAVAKAEACKSYCVENRHDPVALEALCENKDAVLDGALVSMMIDSSAGFGEMGRSRLMGALAQRALQLQAALSFPEGVSRVLHAAQDLPWDAPGHEAIAKAVVALDKGLSHECDPGERERFERLIGSSVAEAVTFYATYPRIAVMEVVARDSERQEALRMVVERAEKVYEIDPRMTYRLVAALASNSATAPDLLRPFAKAEMWTEGVAQRQALGAMLGRVVGSEPREIEHDESPSI